MRFSIDQQSQVSALQAQTDELLRRAGKAVGADREAAKVDKAGKDFETILLGNWLQQAENSFASVPGGDGDDSDAGKDQFQGLAMQALAGSLTRSGGIGIAKMVTEHLRSSQQGSSDPPATFHPRDLANTIR